MFAGEGDPARTNRRFKMLSANSEAKRLSTAFDSVTLYGYDPGQRPGYLRQGGQFRGERLHPGRCEGALWRVRAVRTQHIGLHDHQRAGPHHAGHVSQHGHRSAGGSIQGGPGPPAAEGEYPTDRAQVLSTVRGTVQADILKEDQGQNTCIFAIDFALKMMGDIQAVFHRQQCAQFLLGIHLRLPHRRGRGQPHQSAGLHPGQWVHLPGVLPGPGDAHRQVRPNLSFSSPTAWTPNTPSSDGWPGASGPWPCGISTAPRIGPRCSSTTSRPPGAVLHSQDIQFNDIRTTLQALCAIYDNCQSLHTNAFDEAITTPPRNRCAGRWPSS
jgi:methylmalonyl-CoA mutase